MNAAVEARDTAREPVSAGTVLLVPLAEIGPDPGQPRRIFDEAKIEELALNIERSAGSSKQPWIDGLLHPIVVYLNPAWVEDLPGPRYRLLAGERRWRAYQLRDWPVIPVRVLPAPESDSQLRLVQLNENLGRENTTLWEDAQAVQSAWELWRFENSQNASARAFAAALGRSPSWVSQHLAVNQAKGTLKQALIEGRIRHVEAYRLFAQVPPEIQSQVLNRVRRSGEPITASLARQHLPRTERAATGAVASATLEAPASPRAPESPSDNLEGVQEPKTLFTFFIARHQMRFLLFSLNQSIPEDDRELEVALGRALATIPL